MCSLDVLTCGLAVNLIVLYSTFIRNVSPRCTVLCRLLSLNKVLIAVDIAPSFGRVSCTQNIPSDNGYKIVT